jgi:peptide/nickel transport system substrate-binding protein
MATAHQHHRERNMRLPSFAKSSLLAAAVLTATLAAVPAQAQQNTLKVVMHSDLKIVDPIWTTAYITRNHGYMIYDTLFAMDGKGEIKPQMIDKYTVSADKLTWTFTLRDGLMFHDDKPVTAEDAVASIKRWAQKDSLGQKMNSFVKEWKVVDAKTFTATLSSPTGLCCWRWASRRRTCPSSCRSALPRPARTSRSRSTSAPARSSSRPMSGSPATRRSTPSSPSTSRVPSRRPAWPVARWPRSTASNGAPSPTARPRSTPPGRRSRHGRGHRRATAAGGGQGCEHQDVRPEPAGQPVRAPLQHDLHKPFDNPKIRQAPSMAFNQEDFLKAVHGDAKYYKLCKALFICGSPLATDKGMEGQARV